MLVGEGSDDPQPYVDVILKEPVLKGSGIPIVTDLLSLAIKDGESMKEYTALSLDI